MSLPSGIGLHTCLLIIASICATMGVDPMIEFDRQFIGTTLKPCLGRLVEGAHGKSTAMETFESVKTVLTVISSKFSRLLVTDQFAYQENYVHNYTYYQGSNLAAIYSGEVAAKINKKNGITTLKLIYTVLKSKNAEITETGVYVALESAIKANQIFPGTVEGIALDKPKSLTEMQRTLSYLQLLKTNASVHDIKLGVLLGCYLGNKEDPLHNIKQKIVIEADFVICAVVPTDDESQIGAAAAFQAIEEYLLEIKQHIHEVNPNVVVIGMTQWSSSGNGFWQTTSNLVEYWRTAGEWAHKNKFMLYLREAIDNLCLQHPTSQTQYGWWKLSDTFQIRSMEAYVEKASETFSTTVNKTVVGSTGDATKCCSVSGRYFYNFTYYEGSLPNVYSAEAAALINREIGNKVLTLTYNILPFPNAKQTESQYFLAFEAAEKANQIFPGTMEAISLHAHSHQSAVPETLSFLRMYKMRAAILGLKLGASLNCNALVSQQSTSLVEIYHQIINESDFIICWRRQMNDNLGPEDVANVITKELWAHREFIRKINPNAEVIGHTGWFSAHWNNWDYVRNLKSYWEAVNEWAVANEYTFYLGEAFDNPVEKGSSAQIGWWKLTDNSKINMVEGYVEKITETAEARTPINATNEADESVVKNDTATISLSVIGGFVIIMIASLSFFLLYLRKHPKGLKASEVRDFIFGTNIETSENLSSFLNCALASPYNNNLEIPKEKLTIDKTRLLGSGQFGFVFKGLLKTGDSDVEVAVKVAKSNCPSVALKGLLSEIKIMSFLGQHPNIVALIGANTAELSRGVVLVATELCALGSLQSFLRNHQRITEEGNTEQKNTSLGPKVHNDKTETQLTPVDDLFPDMVRWSYQIACGMEFLAGKCVVHADLAARNVLLTCNKTAKVADFGLSRRMYNYVAYVKKSKDPLPWRWMAIESLKRMEFSSKSDVWSYGITLWEIFSMGDTPYPGVNWSEQFIAELVNGLRPTTPSYAPQDFYNVMRLCWDLEPNKRPNFSELVGYTKNWVRKYGSHNDGTSLDNISVESSDLA